jgi:hypothetical protein
VNTIDAEGMEPHQNSPTISWQAPQSGTVKVNWNAAIDKNQVLVMGLLLGIAMDLLWLCEVPLIFSLLIRLWRRHGQPFRSCCFARRLDFCDIVLEGDALQIVKEINSPIPSLSCFGHFIDGIKEELCSIRSYKVRHER